MLRRNANSLNSELVSVDEDAPVASNGIPFSREPDSALSSTPSNVGPVDIQREINRMEEMILDSPRIPLTRRTLIDEDQLLYQLDMVRLALPTAFQEALDIIRRRNQIVIDAERYAHDVIEAAQRQAAQIIDETGLVTQAEAEANQIRQRVHEECEAAREQAMAEIERARRQSQKEIEAFQQQVVADSAEIQRGADEYAARVLGDMERQMNDMIRVIRNGRHHLQIESPAQKVLPGVDSSAQKAYRPSSHSSHPSSREEQQGLPPGTIHRH
ncbi:MAG: hypothetical protein VKL39_03620 [Leptolyngbyaceae bacterium]|nr:hypothetical protein [Leptolyngbyaceae bacterium]